MINTAIMVNMGQTAVTIGLLGNWGDSRFHGSRTPFTPGPAGFPQQSVPLPTLPPDEGWSFFPLPRYSRGILPLPLPCKTQVKGHSRQWLTTKLVRGFK